MISSGSFCRTLLLNAALSALKIRFDLGPRVLQDALAVHAERCLGLGQEPTVPNRFLALST